MDHSSEVLGMSYSDAFGKYHSHYQTFFDVPCDNSSKNSVESVDEDATFQVYGWIDLLMTWINIINKKYAEANVLFCMFIWHYV